GCCVITATTSHPCHAPPEGILPAPFNRRVPFLPLISWVFSSITPAHDQASYFRAAVLVISLALRLRFELSYSPARCLRPANGLVSPRNNADHLVAREMDTPTHRVFPTYHLDE